jgi:hypothetical protein
MPNGKGQLDCRYCVYARPTDGDGPPLVGSSIKCLFHEQELPAGRQSYRFCIHFQANNLWYAEGYGFYSFFPIFVQIARLNSDLEPGMLYCYECGIPNSVEPVRRLRVPDFENLTWNPADT